MNRIIKNIIIKTVQLLLSYSFSGVTLLCITQPYLEIIALGLSVLAVLATFSGLCLRLSSALDPGYDKKLALQMGEKYFLSVVLFAMLLSIKVSLEMVESMVAKYYSLPEIYLILKYSILTIIAIMIILVLLNTIQQISTLVNNRSATWEK